MCHPGINVSRESSYCPYLLLGKELTRMDSRDELWSSWKRWAQGGLPRELAGDICVSWVPGDESKIPVQLSAAHRSSCWELEFLKETQSTKPQVAWSPLCAAGMWTSLARLRRLAYELVMRKRVFCVRQFPFSVSDNFRTRQVVVDG